MNVLVVGGAGYIGSHAVALLLEAGHNVTVYDNLSRGHAASVPEGRLVEGDLHDQARLRDVLSTNSIDAVMHFAAFAEVGESVRDPAIYYQNNVVAALSLWIIFYLFFKYTPWGLSMQATADDEMAALSLGISVRFVYSAAWIIAFMTAAVGGAFLGAKNGLNISVGELSLLVLPAVVLGGLNSVPGAIVGGITIGVLQELSGFLLDPYFPGGVKDTAPYVFMVLFLLFKPYGLWGWVRIERV